MLRGLILVILSLGLSFSSRAELGEKGSDIKDELVKETLRHHNALFSERFIHQIRSYNRHRKDPEKLFESIRNKEYKKFLQGYFRKHRIQALPRIRLKGETAYIKMAQVTIEFSIVDIYKKQIHLNGHTYHFEGFKTPEEFNESFAAFLKEKVNLTAAAPSLWDFIISKASASDEGFHYTVGSVMALEFGSVEDAEWDGWISDRGPEDALRVRDAIKRRANECQEVLEEGYIPITSEFHEFHMNMKTNFYDQDREEVMAVSRELSDYLLGNTWGDDHHKWAKNKCQKMGAELYQIKSKNYTGNLEVSLEKNKHRHKKREYALDLCGDINDLRMCLAQHEIERVDVSNKERREYNKLIDNYRKFSAPLIEDGKSYQKYEATGK